MAMISVVSLQMLARCGKICRKLMNDTSISTIFMICLAQNPEYQFFRAILSLSHAANLDVIDPSQHQPHILFGTMFQRIISKPAGTTANIQHDSVSKPTPKTEATLASFNPARLTYRSRGDSVIRDCSPTI